MKDKLKHDTKKIIIWDFPTGPMVKNPPAKAGDTGSVPGPGRFHTPKGNHGHAPHLPSLHSSLWATLLSLPATTAEDQMP